MSLYGAMNIGVAGLAANSAALSATSSNIANVNTVGYKGVTVDVLDLPELRSMAVAALAGVTMKVSQNVTRQGLPTNTGSPTDMSISGNGFFVVAAESLGDRIADVHPRRQFRS